MPALRPGSFLSRVFGQRSLPPPAETTMGAFGVPFSFKPKQSLEAYSEESAIEEDADDEEQIDEEVADAEDDEDSLFEQVFWVVFGRI